MDTKTINAHDHERPHIGVFAEILAGIDSDGVELCYLGRVYVAYLDEDGAVLNCYGIALMPGEDAERAVAADFRAQRRRPAGVLVGPAAELLHLALFGRLAGQDPDLADVQIALGARWALASGMGQVAGFEEAYSAAAQWGDFIMPRWGCSVLDERGRIVEDAPELGWRIDLPIGVRA